MLDSPPLADISFGYSALGCAALSVVYLTWVLIRHYVVSSSLDRISGPRNNSFIQGNLGQLFGPLAWDWHHSLVQTYGKVVKLRGWFGAPWLYVSDAKALHAIIVKDQYVFEETSWFFLTNRLSFGEGLLATAGEHHRKQRKLLNPVFSPNHMRDIIPIFYPITYKLRDAISTQIKQGKTELDILYWVSRAALEFIGQAGLGCSFDDLGVDDPAKPYTVAAKSFVTHLGQMGPAIQFFPSVFNLVPGRILRFLGTNAPSPPLRGLINIVDTMTNTAKQLYREKMRALTEGDKDTVERIGHGKDIMSVLMRANLTASVEDRLPESEVIGQINTLLFTGSDTTSNGLARILWILSQNQDAQDKLRIEVTEARRNFGDLMYDELSTLPFLDAVCRETLRLYPPVSVVDRIAVKDTVMPLSEPIVSTNGEVINEICVPKGTYVTVGIMAANRDPSIWGPDAHEWVPARWLEPLPNSIGEARLPGVYSNMMTFLGGGRACIGFKFSQLEMKVVLSLLLEFFKFEPGEKEIVWLMHGLAVPATRGRETEIPHLPMKVSLVCG